jgi:hypothetical protein
MDWQKRVDLLNLIKRQDDEAAARVAPATLPIVRDWWLVAEERARVDEAARAERDRVATEAHESRKRRDMDQRTAAQNAWAAVRTTLRDHVSELQKQVAAAEAKTNSPDDVEAGAGIVELAVAERRLAAAQRDFAMHMSRMP